MNGCSTVIRDFSFLNVGSVELRAALLKGEFLPTPTEARVTRIATLGAGAIGQMVTQTTAAFHELFWAPIGTDPAGGVASMIGLTSGVNISRPLAGTKQYAQITFPDSPSERTKWSASRLVSPAQREAGPPLAAL